MRASFGRIFFDLRSSFEPFDNIVEPVGLEVVLRKGFSDVGYESNPLLRCIFLGSFQKVPLT